MRYVFAATLLLSVASPALAHRLHCDPKIVGDRLRVEVYYEDETPAQGAKVSVRYDETLIAEGRTDEKGEWLCPRPAPGVYTVRVESLGHAAKRTIKIEPPSVDLPDEAQQDDRAEKTGTQWSKLVVGLATIAGLCGVWVLLRRARRGRIEISSE